MRSSVDAAVEDFLDRQQVRDCLLRYAFCLDSFDVDGIRELFTDDARFQADVSAVGEGGDPVSPPPVNGGETIARFIAEMTATVAWQHHLLDVYLVDIDGDRAQALTYVISHKTAKGSPSVVSIVVGRYLDRLRRLHGSWRISEKLMEVGWMETREVDGTSAIAAAYATRSRSILASLDVDGPR